MAANPPASPIRFEVERSDLSIQATFRTHLWALFHNIPQLYSALLTELGELGVTANSIKSDTADGSLGAYNVNFWLMNFRAQVRIRLEQLEIHFTNIVQADADKSERLFLQLARALAAVNEEFAFSGYAVDIGLHGQPIGIEPKEYLARFVGRRPQLPGPYIASGAVFYFGEEGHATLRTLTADLSGLLTDKLYVRIYSVFKDTVRPERLRSTVEEHTSAALRSIDLVTTPAG